MMDTQPFVQDLRALADWYDFHPEAPVPSMHLNVFVDTKEELAAVARMLGDVEKGGDDSWFFVRRRFGSINFDCNVSRKIACTARVVRTEHVPERVVPAYEREIVEWDCPPILEQASE